jgi:chaperonin GroEL
MSIKVEFGTELKKKILEGVNKLNKTVSSTLGPGGRNVIIRDSSGEIRISKDGVSVAKNFMQLEDPVEDIGAQLIKQVSIKSADKAGDGTTTSTLLASVMVSEGAKSIDRGSNPIEVKRGIDKAVKSLVDALKSISQDISSEEQIRQVATISANNDQEVGELIARAMEKVGRDGVVTIEESKTGETTLEVVEGMQFERGYKSPYFVTDNNTMQAILEKPYILLYDGRITTAKQLLGVLNYVSSSSSSLLIIAEDIDGEALATLIVNKARGIIKAAAVKAPGFGEIRTHILEDIATLTGGMVLSKDKGHNLEKLAWETPGVLGTARLATVGKDDTTIVDGKGDEKKIADRLMALKEQIDNATSAYEIEKLQERLAKMIGGVAIINVGGMSEVELKEKKDRIDDALHATKAAIEEGIVPGGGMALLNCQQAIDSVTYDNKDQLLGAEIVKRAISTPFAKILENAGIDNHYEILYKVRHEAEKAEGDAKNWWGYNAKTSNYENFLESGVIDPTKVTRNAIENAASVAGTIITTESAVFIHEEKAKTQDDMGMGDFM